MDIEDVLFDENIPAHIREVVFSYMLAENMSRYDLVLTPTSSNNDINGSQHVNGGGTDFTYEDVDAHQVANATSLGDYEYFSKGEYGDYTGHYYEGSPEKFRALVIDPPLYAVTCTI